MKQMKKYAALFLAVVLVAAAFAGCSASGKGTSGEASQDEYTRGTITDNHYESAWIGLKVDLTDDYVMGDEEEINSMIDFGGDAIYKDEDKQILDYAKANSVYEMMAATPDQTANLILMTEKLSLKNTTEEQYIDSLKSQLTAMTDIQYTVQDDVTDVTVGGLTFKQLSTTCVSNGVTINQNYLVLKKGDRMIAFISTYMDDKADSMQALLNAFTPYAE